MQHEKINVRGVLFDSVSAAEALDVCREFLEEGGAKTVFTPNSEIVQACVENEKLRDTVNSADLVIPDGAGVVLASKLLKTPLAKGKVAGIELFEAILAHCADESVPVFLLGGKPGVAEEAAEKLKEKYPSLTVAGTRDGYFEKIGPESDGVVETIKSSGARFCGVCLGAPAQENWISENKGKFGDMLLGGFGGSLDVFAGRVKRAPKFFIKLRLEWLYRLFKQPSRIGRMMKIPKLLIGCLFAKKK